MEKLSKAETLNEEIVLGLLKEMPEIQGNLFVKILDLVGRENWQNMEIYRSVAHLLTLPNHFLNRKVYDFLSPLKISDGVVVKAIEEYEKDRKQ